MTTPTAPAHTPGPWKYWTSIALPLTDGHGAEHRYHPVTHHGRTVALVPIRQRGDLTLTAAAPDVLAALEGLIALSVFRVDDPRGRARRHRQRQGLQMRRLIESVRCALLNRRTADHVHSLACLPHDGTHGPCALCWPQGRK